MIVKERGKTNIGSFVVDDIRFDIIIQGQPAVSAYHGPLGWSTVAMARGRDRIVLIDVGAFPYRRLLRRFFEVNNLRYEDVTDVLLTHCHYDHSINWIMFPRATVYISAEEMRWATSVPWGDIGIPELYMRELARARNMKLVHENDIVADMFKVHDARGHTPGSTLFVMYGSNYDVIFTGDAAKNRMELLSRRSVEAMDSEESSRTFERIWSLWRDRIGSIVVPGHDVPMTLLNGSPKYMTEREAGIVYWNSDRIEDGTVFNLNS